jgi:hypothetical protein
MNYPAASYGVSIVILTLQSKLASGNLTLFVINKVIIVGVLILIQTLITTCVVADDLPDFLYSKGGIIYPRTGDSSQEAFRTPPFAKDYLKPGMLIGVLPNDFKSASRGSIGDYYICHHDLFLKPEEMEGKTVYRVIEAN